MSDKTRAITQLGHAFGGPTWLLLRPDGRVVVRMAFGEAEREEPFSGLDEVVGVLTSGGRLLPCEGMDQPARKMAFRARIKGRQLFRYGGERTELGAVWMLIAYR